MIRCICIVLLAGILFPGLTRLAIVINYQFNKDFIAKTLCVNRRQPKSCCEGKCQLNRVLGELEKKENPSPFPQLKDKAEVAPCTLQDQLSLMVQLPWIGTVHSVYERFVPAITLDSLFQPPNRYKA